MSKYTELQQQIDDEKAKTAKLSADLRQREFDAFFSSGEMLPKVSPAVKADLMPILEFAAGAEAYEFSAPDPDDETKTVTVRKAPVDMIKEFARKHLPDVITFAEIATKKSAAGNKSDMTNAQKIAAKAAEFQKAEEKAGRVITITEAVNHVMNN